MIAPLPPDVRHPLGFLEERRSVLLGGSDMAVVCGLKPFGKTPRDLFAEIKAGKPELLETGYLRRGRALEGLARSLYVDASGRAVVSPTDDCPLFFTYPEPPKPDKRGLLGVHVDGLVTGEKGDQGALEIKTVTERELRKIEVEGVRDSYVIQLQAGMMAAGVVWGSFCFFCPQAWEMYWFDEEADIPLQGLIYRRALEFQRFVDRDEPPPPEWGIPVRATVPTDLEAVAPDEVEVLIDELRELDRSRSHFGAQYETLIARLKGWMDAEERTYVESPHGYLRKINTKRDKVDLRLLKAEHPEIDWSRYEYSTAYSIVRPYFYPEVDE